MEPVVYNFRVNQHGTTAHLLAGGDASCRAIITRCRFRSWCGNTQESLSYLRRAELDHFTARSTGPRKRMACCAPW